MSMVKHMLFAALAVCSLQCRAAPVMTIDFDKETPRFLQASNTIIDGFRFSPNCHYDLDGPRPGGLGFNDTNWMGFDGSGCFAGADALFNKDFLGPAQYGRASSDFHEGMWFDFFEHPFTLESAFFNDHLQVISSKGGFIDDTGRGMLNFTGSQWTGVQWIMVLHQTSFGAPVGFDQLTVRAAVHAVPEPSSLGVMAVAMAVVGLTRRGWKGNRSPVARR